MDVIYKFYMTPRATPPPLPRTEALLAFRGASHLSVGSDRIAMLEAVAAHGSITAAAKALGHSYKAVWDGLNAVNNLLPGPALLTQSGGRGGGGASLTDSGRHLIAAFRRLEAKLTEISTLLGRDEPDAPTDLLFWNVAMKTSARNALRCQVTGITRAPVNAEIALRVSPTCSIVAVITRHSADDLGLAPGRDVVALIKATFVFLARTEDAPPLSVANRIAGTVLDRVDGGVNTEITVDIGEGKTLTSVITRRSAEALALRKGTAVTALFDAAHVILAVG
jgi:molybdate transport system regulatory protein